jgi:hypothetical protein
MKKNYLVSGLTIASAVIAATFAPQLKTTPKKKVKLSFAQAFADSSSARCDNRVEDDVLKAKTRESYGNPAIGHFHEQMYRFNKIETSDVEMMFCRLARVLGVDPDLTQLPVTVEKTDPRGHSISVAVTAPTESFATTLGYEAKAVVQHDGTPILTMYWSGSGDTSKGFIIQGANPMQRDGMKRLRYIQWDRSSSSQSVKILATKFVSSFLGSVSGSSQSKSAGDNIHFGRDTYNTSTNAISGQSVEIRKDRGGANSFNCLKTMFDGTLGGTISAYRPANGTPFSVTDSSKDGTGMDGRTGITDSETTPANSGTVVSSPATLPASFDYSCNDLNNAAHPSHPFDGGAVNFSATPSSIFPN